MKLNCIASLLGAGSALAFSAAAVDATPLNGGKITPLELNVVETSPDHLNFCFAKRFSDGSIQLNHSTGIHTVTERGCTDISTDNGKTWKKAPGILGGINSFENSSGQKMQISCWDIKPSARHTIEVRTFDDQSGKISVSNCEIELPYSTQFLLHRDVIRTRDNRLLATSYGTREGDKNYHLDLIESTDDGKSWHFLTTIVDDKEARYPEGPCESTLVELADGTLLTIYRVAGNMPSQQCRSTDGGKSWSAPEPSVDFGASPHACLLSDGTLAVVTGRPGLFLFLDFTGTGREYQRYQIYNNSTSSYASVFESAPGVLSVVYDESNFGSSRGPSPFARIVMASFKVEKGDFKLASGDPRAEKYNVFYSPIDRQLPEELKIAVSYYYQPKSAGWPTWVEVVDIPERPHPVLRIYSHGDANVAPSSQWSNYSSTLVPDGVKKLDIGFEFRLGEADLKTPQFMVSGTVDQNGGGRCFGYATFAVDGIHYLSEGKDLVAPMDLGTTNFHAFRMEIDGENKVWKLYRQGEAKPILSAKTTPTETAGISWGDGSGGVFGSADLSYIGWKY